jgi:serine/threonine protein kinase
LDTAHKTCSLVAATAVVYNLPCRYQVEREIRIHIQLDHVNIIKLYAAFEDEKNVYMVQEYAAGGDLFEDLKRNGGSIKEKYTVRDIIVPFLNALQYLHGLVRSCNLFKSA